MDASRLRRLQHALRNNPQALRMLMENASAFGVTVEFLRALVGAGKGMLPEPTPKSEPVPEPTPEPKPEPKPEDEEKGFQTN